MNQPIALPLVCVLAALAAGCNNRPAPSVDPSMTPPPALTPTPADSTVITPPSDGSMSGSGTPSDGTSRP